MQNEVKSGESAGCIDLRTAKQDSRPKKGWWAPGNYFNRCRLCGCVFIGDKRAGHCADCEYNATHDGRGTRTVERKAMVHCECPDCKDRDCPNSKDQREWRENQPNEAKAFVEWWETQIMGSYPWGTPERRAAAHAWNTALQWSGYFASQDAKKIAQPLEGTQGWVRTPPVPKTNSISGGGTPSV